MKKKVTREELEKAQKEFMNEVEKYTDSMEDTFELLGFLSKFKKYSFKNRVMLHMNGVNAPDTYAGWKKRGYQVQKGAKAFSIWHPTVIKTFYHDGAKKALYQATAEEQQLIKDGVINVNQYTTYTLKPTVFDALQTDMESDELPKLYANKHIEKDIDNDKAKVIINNIKKVIDKLNVKYSEATLENWNGGFSKGYYVPSKKEIVLNPQNTNYEKISVLLHETTHAILHSDNANTVSKELGIKLDKNSYEIGELQAEMTTYLIDKSLGMDDESSVRYVSGWTDNGKELSSLEFEQKEKVLSDVVKVSDYLINAITED